MVIDLSLTDSVRSIDLSLALLPSVIDEYLLTCKLDGKTLDTRGTYKRRLRIFCKYLTDKNLDLTISRISVHYIRNFIAYLMDHEVRNGKKMDLSTVGAYYRCLHSLFEWAIREGYLTRDRHPMNNINPPKVPKKKPRPFSDDDWQRLLYLCEGNSFMDIRNRAMVLVDYDTGLRLSELSAIKMKDFNLETGLIKVMGKGKKERTVRIGIKARKALMRYLRLRNDKCEELWQSASGRPIAQGAVQTAIERLCKRAEITDAKPGPHTFRHSCAFSSLKGGAGLYDLKELFGHEDIRTTQRYLDAYNSEIACEHHEKFSPVDNMK